MIWFTSDLHFGHANVLEFASRPWSTLEEMHDGIIDNINGCVGADDDLYVLGDFSFKATRSEAEELRKRINCKRVHLVPGNHDRNWTIPEVADTFIVEPPIRVLKVDGLKMVLSHYPLADWQGMSRGSWHLHGHIHSPRLLYNELNARQGLLRYDVGVDANVYSPVSLDELREWFSGIEPNGRVRWWDWVNQTRDAEVEEILSGLLEGRD